MENAEALTREQIQAFLKGSEAIEFSSQNRAELYGWVQQVLVAQEYASQGKKERGGVRAYIGKVTGMSQPQLTRLIRQYRGEGVVNASPYRRQRHGRDGRFRPPPVQTRACGATAHGSYFGCAAPRRLA